MCLFNELSLDTGESVGYRDHRRTDAADAGRGGARIDQGQGAMRGPMHTGSLPQESRVELRRAACSDLLKLFEIHRAVFLPHIARIWGWDERWQRGNFLEEMATASTGWCRRITRLRVTCRFRTKPSGSTCATLRCCLRFKATESVPDSWANSRRKRPNVVCPSSLA